MASVIPLAIYTASYKCLCETLPDKVPCRTDNYVSPLYIHIKIILNLIINIILKTMLAVCDRQFYITQF